MASASVTGAMFATAVSPAMISSRRSQCCVHGIRTSQIPLVWSAEGQGRTEYFTRARSHELPAVEQDFWMRLPSSIQINPMSCMCWLYGFRPAKRLQ